MHSSPQVTGAVLARNLYKWELLSGASPPESLLLPASFITKLTDAFAAWSLDPRSAQNKHIVCRAGPGALVVIEAHVVRLSKALRDSWGGTKPLPCQGKASGGAKGPRGHGS